MRKLFTILVAVLLTASVFLPQQASAQSPEKMSYQAVVRDASDNLVTNQEVGMQISILKGSESGSSVYAETRTDTTNANGLVSVEIGTGTTSDDFSTIDWTDGPYFIKTETDPTGGTSYTITGTSQLLSVPYALHAKTAESITGDINENDPVFDASIASAITAADTTNWNNKLDAEVDGSVTNELQTLSVSNDTIYLSNGGFAKIPAQQPKTYAVGDTAFGGIIFYVNDEGTHGLVCAKTDQAYDGTAGSLVDYNEAPCLCSDRSRFDEQGQKYFDWRLPTLKEMEILTTYYDNSTTDDLLDILKLGKGTVHDDNWYWSSDVFIVSDPTDLDSYTSDDKSMVRRYCAEIQWEELEPDKDEIEYMQNVRCVRSF